MICGGGTGGHLYPALALSDAIFQSGRGIKVLFAGPGKNKEQVLRHNRTMKFFSVSSAPLSGTPFSLAKNAAVLCSGFVQAYLFLSREKPDAVAGMGAYSSVPVALAASVLKIPLFLHEQNAVPGKATLVLSRFAKKIFLSFESSLAYFHVKREKLLLTGNPVRSVSSSMKKSELLAQMGFSDRKKTVLVFGGSHGAKKINNAVADMLDFISSQEHFQVVHVSGLFDFERIKNISTHVKNLRNYHVFAYRENLLDYMAASDLVACRAGATTCAELLALGKPSVLIPYPYAANQHQLKNAEELVRDGAAVLLRDEQVSAESLKETICGILMEPSKLFQMAESCSKNAKPDAGSAIAEELLRGLVDKTS